jgi:hypothetical protein
MDSLSSVEGTITENADKGALYEKLALVHGELVDSRHQLFGISYLSIVVKGTRKYKPGGTKQVCRTRAIWS